MVLNAGYSNSRKQEGVRQKEKEKDDLLFYNLLCFLCVKDAVVANLMIFPVCLL